MLWFSAVSSPSCVYQLVSLSHFWGFNLSWSCSQIVPNVSLSLVKARRPGLSETGALRRGSQWSRIQDTSWIQSYEWSASVVEPGATTARSSWGLASDVIVTSRRPVGVNLGSSHTITASEHTTTQGWMKRPVATTGKNTRKVSSGGQGSRSGCRSLFEARVCVIVTIRSPQRLPWLVRPYSFDQEPVLSRVLAVAGVTGGRDWRYMQWQHTWSLGTPCQYTPGTAHWTQIASWRYIQPHN